MPPDTSAYVSPPALARRLGVKPESVIGWIRSGELPAINVGRRGASRPRYRISAEAVSTFEAGRAAVPVRKATRRPRAPDEVGNYY